MIAIPYNSQSTADEVLADLDLSNHRILITGCSGGIGFETMRALSARGAAIIGLARSLDQAQKACSRIKGAATAVECDQSDLRSVGRAAEFVAGRFEKVDVIIANAGMTGSKSLETSNGVEMQFLVNYLSHFLLVNSLLSKLPDSNGRVVVISSSASKNQAPRDGILFDDLDGHAKYSSTKFYGQSKLALALFAAELARRLQNRGITVNSLHPGAVRDTDLNRNVGFPLSIVLRIAELFFKIPAEGASTQCMLAASPLAAGISGEYWENCQIAQGSKYLTDSALRERLWRVSEDLIERILNAAS